MMFFLPNTPRTPEIREQELLGKITAWWDLDNVNNINALKETSFYQSIMNWWHLNEHNNQLAVHLAKGTQGAFDTFLLSVSDKIFWELQLKCPSIYTTTNATMQLESGIYTLKFVKAFCRGDESSKHKQYTYGVSQGSSVFYKFGILCA